MDVLWKLLWIVVCITVPVVWGVIVHAVFERLRSRPRDDEDSVLSDFQI